MKKKIVSLVAALSIAAVSILGSLAGLIGTAASISKNDYPYSNRVVVIKQNYSTTATSKIPFYTVKYSKSDLNIADGVLNIVRKWAGEGVKFGHKHVDTGEGSVAMVYDIDNSGNEEITIRFTPYSNTTYSIKKGGYYYLISSSGSYQRESYNENGEISIAAGYKGTMVVPFDNFRVGSAKMDPALITGFNVELSGVGKNASKTIKFDNFGYIGRERYPDEIDPSEFPYTLNNRWDEYDFKTLPAVSGVGGLSGGKMSVENETLKVSLSGAGKNDGFSLKLSDKYSAEYDATYFKVDATELSGSINLKTVWKINGNDCALKKGAAYYLRTSDGICYKKSASSEGVVTITGGNVTEIAIPYESIVIKGSSTKVSAPDVTGVTVTFENVPNADVNLYFDDFGYVKKTSNSFIIPPVISGTVVTKDNVIVDMERETKVINDGTTIIQYLENCEKGVDERDVSYEGGRTGIPYSGNPEFTQALSSTKDYQGISFDLDTTEVSVPINLGLTFTQGSGYAVIGEGKPFFLYNEHDGLYYRVYQTGEGAKMGIIEIPANFKGKVIVPFSSLVGPTGEAFEHGNMSLTVSFKDLNGNDRSKFIWFDNITQHKTDDNIGDKAYKIPSLASNIRVEHTMDSDESPESPMSSQYWIYAHGTDFKNSFVKEGALNYTCQKLLAIRDIGGAVNLWGASFAGSWTAYGRNALMVYYDSSNCQSMVFKPMVFMATYEGESLGRWTVNSNSKIFLYREDLGMSKLATISGNNIVLNGYKGWIVIPLTQLVPDEATNKDKSFENVSLVRSIGYQMMISGMKEGEYLLFDEARLVFWEAPSVIPTWIPEVGYTGKDYITGSAGGSIGSGAATGNAVADTVAVAGLIGLASLGFAFYGSKKKKKAKAR